MFDKIKALKWLDEKWKGDKKCDICQENKWTIAADLVTPVLFSGSNTIIGGNSYPQLMIICNNCGNTKCINAVIMGVNSKEEKKNVE